MNALSEIIYQSLEGVVTVDEILVDIPPSWQPHNCPGFNVNNFPLNQVIFFFHFTFFCLEASLISHQVQKRFCFGEK